MIRTPWPAPDNGIKFFARGGTKLPDEVEDAIEATSRAVSRRAAATTDVGTICAARARSRDA